MRQIRQLQQAEYRNILQDQKVQAIATGQSPIIKINNPVAGSVRSGLRADDAVATMPQSNYYRGYADYPGTGAAGGRSNNLRDY